MGFNSGFKGLSYVKDTKQFPNLICAHQLIQEWLVPAGAEIALTLFKISYFVRVTRHTCNAIVIICETA